MSVIRSDLLALQAGDELHIGLWFRLRADANRASLDYLIRDMFDSDGQYVELWCAFDTGREDLAGV